MSVGAGALLLVLVLGGEVCRAEHYVVSRSHSQVRFSVKKWSVLEVEGFFRNFDGAIRYDPAKPQDAAVTVTVEVASVVTGEGKRDESLAMPEFFDAARHPVMTFQSVAVSAGADGKLQVKGNLRMKGVSRMMVIAVEALGVQEIPGEGELATFHTEFTLDRRDFGVLGGTLSRTMVGNEVRVRLTLGGKRAVH